MGRILNVSSTASPTPGPLQAVYYATKSYITFLSNALTEELRDTNITVTALMPGATDTEFGAIVGIDKTVLWDHLADPREVAEAGYRPDEPKSSRTSVRTEPRGSTSGDAKAGR